MPAAFDNVTVATSSSGTSLAGTHTPLATPTLVIFTLQFVSDDAVPLSAPLYGAQATTLVHGPVRSDAVTVYVYKLESPPSGAQPFSFALNRTNIERACSVTTFTGTLSSSTTRTAAAATGSDDAPLVDVTTIAGDLVYDALTTFNDKDPVADASQVERYSADDEVNLAGSTKPAVGVLTSMSWTLTDSTDWAIIAVPIIGVVLESVAVDITSASSVAVVATEISTEAVSIAIVETSSVSIVASAQAEPPCDPGPPFDTAAFASGIPATLYVALLSQPWSSLAHAVELSGCGYARVAVPNTTLYWTTMAESIRNVSNVTFPQATCDLGVVRGWAIYDSDTADDCENVVAHGVFGTEREIPEGTYPRFPSKNIIVTADRATATLVIIETAPDLWSGNEGWAEDAEWGVCGTCGRTVPTKELLMNPRFGWQCLRGKYGIGCWDGWIQRDEIYYVPPPDEGARRSPTPTGDLSQNRDTLPDDD